MKKESFILGKTIKQLSNHLDRNFNKALKQWELTASQFSVIMYLLDNQSSEVNQKTLEDAFLLKGPTVTGIIKRLVEKGFVERRTDNQDRRIHYLVLTEKSKELEPCMHEDISRLEADILKGISEDKIQLLDELLHQIIGNITDQ
ncbi:MarR family winged helix-turn-helix transcriptional regulator [Acetobacterium bakii]|uniref:HTH marR-type domain-containing protein n=1 Tax=Acetobacterium bakii TaxID=52689 RepID=A0A0L6TYB1_9FIRM|nr:MarR family transcriptional regulator [Acetobacterium bakii]KNZ41233.1 hypothetical protein AKG39_13015 [Acetobacterium bakii]